MTKGTPRTIRDLLRSRSDEPLAARHAELAQLEACLWDGGPLVAWLHGPSGSGKTRLLDEFSRRAETTGATTLNIDCQAVEPTAQGLLGALSELLGKSVDNSEKAAAALAGRGSRVVLAFDNYEAFRLADSWLRLEFIPALDAGSRVVLVSREPPAAGWVSAGDWRQFFISVSLQRSADVSPEERVSSLLDSVAATDLSRSLEALAVGLQVLLADLDLLSPLERGRRLLFTSSWPACLSSRTAVMAWQSRRS